MTVPRELAAWSASFDARVAACRACPRLVAWREEVAARRVRRHADEVYWGRAVPSFGPPDARLLVVGLAPAAHGANRTGRMFTGDRSGAWLYRALHAHGFATRPDAERRDDGLRLRDARVTAIVRCAPPANRPTAGEIARCGAFLDEEISRCARARVIVALGRLADDRVVRIRPPVSGSPPPFAHARAYRARGGALVLASYHPSQQNTFTGRLTWEMFDAIFARARGEIDAAA